MNILGICDNPDILKIIQLIKVIITIIRIVVPIIIIFTSTLDIAKIVSGTDPNTSKIPQIFIYRVVACMLIIFMPTFVNVVLNIAGSDAEYETCLTMATNENIESMYLKKAEELTSKAEETLERVDLQNARIAVTKLEEGTNKKNLSDRLDVVEEAIKKAEEEEKKKQEEEKQPDDETAPDGDPIDIGPGQGSTGKGTCAAPGTVYSSEPNPADPLACTPNIININNFIFPLDSSGRKLGAYPKNYESIPTQLTSYKTYYGEFILPVTPANGTWSGSYDHNGIDFIAVFGTPIYSPVDGTLVYSEWGHTGNKGRDETAYSISILMDKKVTAFGKTLGQVFLTHLTGIRYRCSENQCNRKVKKGELLGFVGNAAGNASTDGWAPHLHMSIYPAGDYNSGLVTDDIEKLYGISAGQKFQAGG